LVDHRKGRIEAKG